MTDQYILTERCMWVTHAPPLDNNNNDINNNKSSTEPYFPHSMCCSVWPPAC